MRVWLILLMLLELLFGKTIPSGLYGNQGVPDSALLKRHLPYDIDMGRATLHCDRLLANRGYVSCYNYSTNTPLWSAYRIRWIDAKKSSARLSTFFYDKRLPKRHRIKPADFRASGWDRGHLYPNALADGDDIVRQAQSFLMSNVAPQHPILNRKGWAYLERAVRKWLRRHRELLVITGVWFDSRRYKTIGHRKRQHIAVPAWWYKIVYDPQRQKAIAFWMPNAEVGSKQWFSYRTSIDAIEKKTGIDFFPKLENRIEQRVEADGSLRF